MKGRLIAIVATVAAAVGLSSGVFALPATAAASTVTTAVFDAAGGAPWTGTEVTGASAYDTATVVGDGTQTPTGTVTYSLFDNGMCTTDADTTTDTETLNDGTVPNSRTEGPFGAGSYSFDAVYHGDANYTASSPSTCESFSVGKASSSTSTIVFDAGTSEAWAGTEVTHAMAFDTSTVTGVVGITPRGPVTYTYFTNGTCMGSGSAAGTETLAGNGSVPHSTTQGPLDPGSYSFQAVYSGDANYAASAVSACEPFTVAQGSASPPIITNIPGSATEFGSFTAAVSTTGDGTGSITSSTDGVCTVGPDGLTVTFVGFGTCTLTASVGQGSNYLGGTGPPQTFTVNPAARGYWLVGSDGGIFSFGAAGFHGSMGGIPLQRPVVGITPTASRNGYWLVASDGGIFAFGDSAYYGSIPGLGLHPAGSGQPNSLDAPIVGMVPSTSRHGYFMVASDGGVFAFGDARFEGSCPGIGGCLGAAVAVMPDSTGNGYWLVTNLGAVYAFGDAGNYGGPPAQSVPAVDAVATPDGHGYWVLYANGAVYGFGDAAGMGAPLGYVNAFNPAAAIFPTADGKGYWVAAARGDVFCYGDAPFMGSMAAAGLNGDIIAGFGF